MKVLKASDLSVGDAVQARSGRYEHHNEYGNVAKITPKGQILVTMAGGKEVRFNKDGNEIGDKFVNRYLVEAAIGHGLDRLKRARMTAAKLLHAIPNTFSRYQNINQDYCFSGMMQIIEQVEDNVIQAKSAILALKSVEQEYLEIEKITDHTKLQEIARQQVSE